MSIIKLHTQPIKLILGNDLSISSKNHYSVHKKLSGHSGPTRPVATAMIWCIKTL